MELHPNNTTNSCQDKMEAVLSVLKPLIQRDQHWPSTTIITLKKYADSSAVIATTVSLDGTETETYSDEWQNT